jgi:Tol biopolymer transport system component
MNLVEWKEISNWDVIPPLNIKYSLIIVVLLIAASACIITAPVTTPTTSPVFYTPQMPEPLPTTGDIATAEVTMDGEPAIPTSAGLRVVYLKDGNLWSWTEAGGNVLLAGTSDINTIRLSDDGQLLAFLRGPEVWTIHMDGSDARYLVTQKGGGGTLSLSPTGSLLAITTADQIDVIDLSNATATTVVTYPRLSSNYYPEALWSPDGMGFKTIVPANSGTGQWQFLFVFANGKTASLATFQMVLPSESPPWISPDGGYVIYVAQLGDGRNSLYLMDSSGATKIFGEPGEHIRALGWLPDSKQFVYQWENQGIKLVLLGGLKDGTPKEVYLKTYETIRWVDAEQFLALDNDSLYLGNNDGGESLIAEGVTDFDFVD